MPLEGFKSLIKSAADVATLQVRRLRLRYQRRIRREGGGFRMKTAAVLQAADDDCDGVPRGAFVLQGRDAAMPQTVEHAVSGEGAEETVLCRFICTCAYYRNQVSPCDGAEQQQQEQAAGGGRLRCRLSSNHGQQRQRSCHALLPKQPQPDNLTAFTLGEM
jgi:hypothetical protein